MKTFKINLEIKEFDFINCFEYCIYFQLHSIAPEQNSTAKETIFIIFNISTTPLERYMHSCYQADTLSFRH